MAKLKSWPVRLLDWRRLRRFLTELPDLPEVRRFARLSWMGGFLSAFVWWDPLEDRAEQARQDAVQAVARKMAADRIDRLEQLLKENPGLVEYPQLRAKLRTWMESGEWQEITDEDIRKQS